MAEAGKPVEGEEAVDLKNKGETLTTDPEVGPVFEPRATDKAAPKPKRRGISRDQEKPAQERRKLSGEKLEQLADHGETLTIEPDRPVEEMRLGRSAPTPQGPDKGDKRAYRNGMPEAWR